MAAVLKHWREAATLIILAPATRLHPSTATCSRNQQGALQRVHMHQSDDKKNDSNGKNVQDYETLLLKRSSKSTFMPNLYVFPGGTSENNDFSSEWISVFEKLGKDFQESMFQKVSRGAGKASPMFTRTRDPQFTEIPPEVAFRISAIRETFEESGILLVKKVRDLKENKNDILSEQCNLSSSFSSSDNNLELNEWRKLVNEDPGNFLKMCKEMDLIPDILSLYEWTEWLTPTMGGRRYDTIFYICCLDKKPEAKADSQETIDHQWISPISVTSSYYQGNAALAPPQIYELSRLLRFGSAVDLIKFSAEREPERVERFFPVIVMAEDAIISLLPGDDLYPKTPDLHTPKNLIQFDQTMEEVNKGVKNFHRSVQNRAPHSLWYIVCNIVFKNNHIGPATNFNKRKL